MSDLSKLYHAILGEMVEELTKKVGALEQEADRLLALPPPTARHTPEEAGRMTGYRTDKAREHLEEADILRQRINALKAGMECLTW